ncbi:tRNA dihydrouridine(20/20a) synthase DusA [Legionella waltersii]|nr:tRNA dihydrouridine(20/20a) synthase DusA [Legionella waltersii]
MVNSILLSKLAIAPMIDWTNSPFRTFMRYLAPKALLYTEMQTVGAIKNNPARALYYLPIEHPIAIQLGGSDKSSLADCAEIAAQAGYDEINLNLGCPSDKVQAGQFGACLMKEPLKVAECIREMKRRAHIPVTAKTRIGIDNDDSYEHFRAFALTLIEAGCDKLIVHSRKAWLNGLNPKQNRTIPPVNYDYVYQLKAEIPHVPIVINGNILTVEDVKTHMQYVDGVMVGRLACDNPYSLTTLHQFLYPSVPIMSREELFRHYFEHLKAEYLKGMSLSLLAKPLFNIVHGMPGARQWKGQLSKCVQSKCIEGIAHLSTALP